VTVSSTGSGNAAGSSDWYFSQSTASSDGAGHYELFVFTGTSTVTINPPSLSGFATAVLSNLSVSADFSQLVVLQHPDLSPPQIVAGPLVVHLSDTSVSISWDTSEPSDSVVDFGTSDLTESVTSSSMVTHHEVTLVGLLPSSDYLYQVSSTDPSGNGPTFSDVSGFHTQDPPGDVTAPIITSGPDVTSLDVDSALISWTTNEPASSVVHYGLDASLGTTASIPGTFSPQHAVPLAGLEPATEYFFQVESTDPDDNGPTMSSLSSFTTAALPDTLAPVILSGPEVTGATDTTLTVTWTTDEAASSGVSYNDGVVFGVVSDDALVVTHMLTLAGLTPDTTYQITVSSTEANGNGPTLGGPIDGQTLVAPDVEPPVISNVSVSDITETSARITWTTDELSTTQVSYGTVSGAPTGLQGSAGLSIEHSVLLSGLSPGSEYFFTVLSVDGSGNAAESTEGAFSIGNADADGDGVGDSVDACLGTPSGEIVDQGGCAIAQWCPCSGPKDDGGPWASHGKYLSCVTKVSSRFKKAQLITPEDRAEILRAARKSACGKKEKGAP